MYVLKLAFCGFVGILKKFSFGVKVFQKNCEKFPLFKNSAHVVANMFKQKKG